MTNERMYKNICDMLRAYDAVSDGAMNAAEEVIKNPHEWQNSTYFPFYATAAQMLLDARRGMDKAQTSGARVSALNRIYKNCSDHRPELRGFFRSGDRWALCDGYRFVRLNSKPDSIPYAAYSDENSKFEPVDLNSCIPQGAADAETVELPSVADVKAFIAANKYKSGHYTMYKPMEALPGWWCNPQYLLDVLSVFPSVTAYKPLSAHSPLYCVGEDGDALVLPVRHTED